MKIQEIKPIINNHNDEVNNEIGIYKEKLTLKLLIFDYC